MAIRGPKSISGVKTATVVLDDRLQAIGRAP
jgi:hypothetical protein